MKKIGLFYGTATAKTAAVAQKIKEAFGEDIVDIIPVERSDEKEFNAYDHIIAGSSTWFDGELPTYWDETLPELATLDLQGKKVALFGLGDQKKYPDNFADGIGILARAFTERGATLIGKTSTDVYHFSRSEAVENGQFLGLVIDIENQSDKTNERIRKWVKQIKTEFEKGAPSSDEEFNC